MKPLGRNIGLISVLKRLPGFIKMGYYSILIFDNPIALWIAYINGSKPKHNEYSLRNGMVIKLSQNEHDSITVMVIFCRKEYGKVSKGVSVIDIGANIGVFTLYALWSGANLVVSVEPNLESFEILKENIGVNRLESRVTLVNRAIAHKVGETIFIPRSSSPYNKVEEFSRDDNSLQPVQTTSLQEIFQNGDISKLDLLKMDCEGAEYDVLFNLDEGLYRKIASLKMEHHNGSFKAKLLETLSNQGLALIHEKYMILWFSKIS